MYYLYFGSGTLLDVTGAQRTVHATMKISDQLETWASGGPGLPVHGTPAPGQAYQFRISNWHVTVERIGTFFGHSGSIYLLLEPKTPPLGTYIFDKMWNLDSDATNLYSWIGQIIEMEQPNDWNNPSAPDYGHLPHRLRCAWAYMGTSTIGQLFSASSNLVLLLKRQ